MHLSKVAAERLLLIHIAGDARAELLGQLSGFGYDVCAVESFEAALPLLAQEAVFPTVLIVAADNAHRMRSALESVLDGIRCVRRVSADSQIILTVDRSVDISICCEAINCGLAGFIETESGRVDDGSLRRRLDQARIAFESARMDAHRMHSGEVFDNTGIVACSRSMAMLLAQAARAAEVSDVPVLIYGESGTGKQLLAQMVHRLDPKRNGGTFLSVNCAAITGTLAESALFGHVKGAFTGATEAREGYFRSADGGTVFLDEIGEMSLELQPKLLRFLQEGVVMPVGSDKEYPVDLRIVAAANRRIPALVEEGRFRLDLYQRLNVITLDIPALRERREDIPLLVDFFVRKYGRQYGKTINRVDRRVYELLSQSSLDGNVRELENTIRRAMAIKSDGDELQLRDLPATLLENHGGAKRTADGPLTQEVIESACKLITSGRMTLTEFIGECERLVLAASISRNGDSHADLSRLLGLSTRTLYNKRRKYRL